MFHYFHYYFLDFLGPSTQSRLLIFYFVLHIYLLESRADERMRQIYELRTRVVVVVG